LTAASVLSHLMKRIPVLPVLAGVALLSVACAKEPTEALNAAKSALAAAKTAEAADYAPAALAAAETAAAALEAEIKAQSEKFGLTRSYTKAAELATAAKSAAEKAAAEAVTGKELLIGNYEADGAEKIDRLSLRPYEARVYRLL